ncbi:DUF1642 domain-containing protein [Collinsella sp. LCP19S3_C6]|uniref:DUF1642 domain-containing protein n=3 Tax=Actinomycetota TaxID=201174 RepID=UPI003F92F0A4
MNKQEAIEEIKKQSTQAYDDFAIMRDAAIHIINQIHELQKVVVPKFVAEWIKWCKTNEATLLGAISPIDEFGSAICNDKRVESMAASRWAQRNQDTFARAWLDGYEIEKEKLYTVEIEGVSSGKLFKNIKTNKYLFHSGNGLNGYTDKLTETEIKQKDERLWRFAVPVEEN